MIKTIIVQNVSSSEIRLIQMACMLYDDITIIRCDILELTSYQAELLAGAMAVGSVEFVRASFICANISEPDNLSYCASAIPYLGRQVKQISLNELKLYTTPVFVKPVTTKLFTGFVVDFTNTSTFDEHDNEQFDIMVNSPSDTMLWVSEVVRFECEWRYYIENNTVLGKARYDPDGSDDAALPCDNKIMTIIAELGMNHPYVLDIGVLSNGETVVVEVNDAWAIGLYGKALSPREYLLFLSDRWQTLVNS